MYLVKSSGFNVHLRDAGDGAMKRITAEGTLFLKAPVDPAVEVIELSDLDVKKYVAKLDEGKRSASIKILADKVLDAKNAFESAKAEIAAATEKLKKLEADHKKALADHADGLKALGVEEKKGPAK